MRTTSMSRLVLFTLAGAGLVVVGAPPSQGADPFVAGGRSTRPVAISPSQTDRAFARAADLAAALGLPGVSRRAERLDDRFEHRTYDEVVAVDAEGNDVSIARFDTDGQVVMAATLGWQARRGPAIDRAAAANRGLEVAAAAGLSVGPRPVVTASAGAGGWSIAWPRSVGGVPVPGDGIRVSLWLDGSFHALTRTERPLAVAPSRRLAAGAAQAIAQSRVADRFAADADQLRLGATELAWVAPNDTWAPERPDAPAATLRLAWIVRLETSGALAERMRLIEYWIDAGDGSLLGGDVVE
jgi:hypothetical protein